MTRSTSRGFTLVELMITIAVLAVGSMLAYPSFSNVIKSNRVATSTNSLIAAFNLARSEAIRSNRGAGVCPSKAGTACEGSDWSTGFIAFTDQDGSGGWSAGDSVLRFFEGNEALTFTAAPGANEPAGNVDVVVFGRSGRAAHAVDFTVKATKCKTGEQYQRQLKVTKPGQTRLEKQACA
ncbi:MULTISPECIES: GspH/FimT family pseudopilin [unclassified Lysobacter]|uniref:GspH/FimT family pseudopilin n=1 Tax=unclassified Lysobacter TaxID=2635362 RepID=UPI001C244423|nr:GspH/FimT family pseudopilin [Lysobacter sp. MMG2]MBU8976442.1 GspH/FimT family pseudopilin [Lysobacter sp. MMG2]